PFRVLLPTCHRSYRSSWKGSSLPAQSIGSGRERRVPCAWGTASPTAGDLRATVLARLAARGDAELAQEALHVRADGVLRDEEALRDLVRAEVVVEQEQHLDL